MVMKLLPGVGGVCRPKRCRRKDGQENEGREAEAGQAATVGRLPGRHYFLAFPFPAEVNFFSPPALTFRSGPLSSDMDRML
jgi:hypothetical protein